MPINAFDPSIFAANGRSRARSAPAICARSTLIDLPLEAELAARVSVLRAQATDPTRALIVEVRRATQGAEQRAANALLDVAIASDVAALPLWNEKLFMNRGRFDVVQATVEVMQRIGVQPNKTTYRLLSWAAELANEPHFGWATFRAMKYASVSSDIKTAINFIQLFKRNFQPHYVWAVFCDMHEANVGNYRAYHDAIKSLLSLRVPYQAHAALLMMRAAGFVPHVTLMNRTLDLYRFVEKPERVWVLYNASYAMNIAPDTRTVSIVQRSFDAWRQRLERETRSYRYWQLELTDSLSPCQ